MERKELDINSLYFNVYYPDFCTHYKKFIVEDFSLNENRTNLHYGNCALVGLCTFDQNLNRYYLGNVRITSLCRELQLPDDCCRVLLFTHLCEKPPPINKFVELFGEAVLYDTSLPFVDESISFPCTNAKDFYRKRSEIERCGLNVNDLSFLQRYIPSVKVHYIRIIDDVHEILNCNLRLKQINQTLKYH